MNEMLLPFIKCVFAPDQQHQQQLQYYFWLVADSSIGDYDVNYKTYLPT